MFNIFWDRIHSLGEDSEVLAMYTGLFNGDPELIEWALEEFEDFMRPHGVFDQHDLDHDGLINWEEYQALHADQMEHMSDIVDDMPEWTLDDVRMSYDAMTSIIGS